MDTASATATAVNNNSINSNHSSSSSGNLSSNSSSGYGSATTTPTTPLGSHYESQPSTPVAVAAAPIPVATVAAVTPYYNESLTATETHQRQQQYYQAYAYPPAAAVVGQAQPLQPYNVYDAYVGESYQQHPSNVVARSSIRHVAQSSSHAPLEKLTAHAKISPNLHHHHVAPSNGSYKHATTSESNGSTKPQAAATAFYAQPFYSSSAGGYFDPYKYKMPTKLPNPAAEYSNYANHLPNAAAASYQQQQYYAAAKSQLQDASYAAAVKPLSASNTRQHNNSYYSDSSSAYYEKYEKYMYPPTAVGATGLPVTSVNVNPATYSSTHPPHFPPETSTESYRKANPWHWNMEQYAAGNCRTLPPGGLRIPTATVPPSNSAYLQQAGPPRESFYTHEKYGKYDKYNAPYYHQQYMPTVRNVWPSSHSHPQHPHFQPTASSATQVPSSAHQSCCSQPFQQQSCYYPRAPHHVANAFPAHPQQTHYVDGGSGGGGGGSSSKYGSISDYPPHSTKLKHSNDLYVTSPFDTTSAHMNFNYGPATSQHRYSSAAAGAVHQTGTAAAGVSSSGDPTTTPFYNDLNLQPTFDNYATTVQQHQHQQQQQLQSHQQQQFAATRKQHLPYPPNNTKSSLLEYRKPMPQSATDCYITQSAISNLEDHVAGPANYPNYDISSNVNIPSMYNNNSSHHNAALAAENADKAVAAKNLSLRDFLATWNEDEEEYAATNELNFVATESQPAEQPVIMKTEAPPVASVNPPPYKHDEPPTAPAYKAQAVPLQTQQQIVENHLQFKGSFHTHPKIQVGITVDSTVNVEANQYINLPDIVIDIEKSNNVASSATSSAAKTTDSKEISFDNFDVEKELDELQIKKSKLVVDKPLPAESKPQEISKAEELSCLKQPQNDNLQSLNVVENSFKGILKQENVENISQDKSLKGENAMQTRIESKIDELVPTNITHSPPPTEHESSFDNPEQFLKDIDYDNNSHSNESTFEKEYETFINKIGHDDSVTVKTTTKDEVLTPSTTGHLPVSEEVQDLSMHKDIIKSDTETTNSSSAENTTSSSSSETTTSSSADTNINYNIKSNSQEDHEFEQNVKDFSKFYKRKRKLIEDIKQDSREDKTQPSTKHKKTSVEINTEHKEEKTQNFPRVTNKKVRKRPEVATQQSSQIVKKSAALKDPRKRKPLSVYYKILNSLHRLRYGRIKATNTTTLVQKHIATMKERHLPLIKRQSVKKYSTNSAGLNFNPKTLKSLSVSIVNTEEFRSRILNESVGQRRSLLINYLIENSEKVTVFSSDMGPSLMESIQSEKENSNVIDSIKSAQEENETKTEKENPHEIVEENLIQETLVQPVEVEEEIRLAKEMSENVEVKNTENIDNEDVEMVELDPHIATTSEHISTQLAEQVENKKVSDEELTIEKPELLVKIDDENISKNLIEVDEDSNSSSSNSDSDSSDDDSSNGTESSSSSSSSSSSDEESRSSSSSEGSDFNELAALEKELSQHNSINEANTNANKTDDNNYEYDNETKTKTNEKYLNNTEVSGRAVDEDEVTHNDIAHLKKMLESDQEEGEDNIKTNVVSEMAIDKAEISNDLGEMTDEKNSNACMDELASVGENLESVNEAKMLAEPVVEQEEGKIVNCVESKEEMIVESDLEKVKERDAHNCIQNNPSSLKAIVTAFLNANQIAPTTDHHDINQQHRAAVPVETTEVTVDTVSIPKLSDLCKIALNSSLESSELTININDSTTPEPNERELSVEEALAEMYRQAGVPSDPEDYDMDDKEAQDVLLINLEEILDSDSDLYVLQCDMNENILGVVAHSDDNGGDGDANTDAMLENTQRAEIVNTLQLVEILNTDDFHRLHNENDLVELTSVNTNTNDNSMFCNESDPIANNLPSSPQSLSSPSSVNDNSLLSAQFDLPSIHHEEIVPENYTNFEKEKFLKYLHEKYVQTNISKFYHANRILKKYKRRLAKKILAAGQVDTVPEQK